MRGFLGWVRGEKRSQPRERLGRPAEFARGQPGGLLQPKTECGQSTAAHPIDPVDRVSALGEFPRPVDFLEDMGEVPELPGLKDDAGRFGSGGRHEDHLEGARRARNCPVIPMAAGMRESLCRSGLGWRSRARLRRQRRCRNIL